MEALREPLLPMSEKMSQRLYDLKMWHCALIVYNMMHFLNPPHTRTYSSLHHMDMLRKGALIYTLVILHYKQKKNKEICALFVTVTMETTFACFSFTVTILFFYFISLL